LRELQRPFAALSADCSAIACRVIDGVLNGEVFTTIREAQFLIRPYNTVKPHSALGYRPPASKSIVPIDQRATVH